MHSHLLIHILELGHEAKMDKFYTRKFSQRASKTIKPEKLKWFVKNYITINDHYHQVVKKTTRSHQLAYALLIDRPYSEVEVKTNTMPNWKEIRIFAMRFYDTTKWPDPSIISDIVNDWIFYAMLWYQEKNMHGGLTQRELLDIWEYLSANKMDHHKTVFYLKPKLKELVNATS